MFALLLSLFFAVCRWQSPGAALSGAEVDGFMRALRQGNAMPEPMRGEFLKRLDAWGRADDGKPFYMLNLMRMHEHLQPWPGVQLAAGTPAEANAFYEKAVLKMALAQGLQLTVGANAVQRGQGSNALMDAGAAENWSRVLLVRYPSRRAFLELISKPEYLEIMPYKFASLDVTLVPTDGESITPDVRVLAGAAALAIMLAFGWLRAIRRARSPA
ncbi:hypothetical protein [Pseudoduganella sp. OTU4001]|uniref:hypothetical protein n=1 Tax=Pseudoduganella sp. OTU4001 TaxID=3043854 RepID=UPI00313A97F5